MGKVEEQPSYLRHTPEYTPWHGHITALTVAPQYRRLGLAKLLTESLERASNEQNAWFVDLYVRESNKVAGGLYRGMGYVCSSSVVEDRLGVVCGSLAWELLMVRSVVKYRYSVFRRVVDYYSDNMTGEKDTEDAFDMRKPLDRDKDLRWIRENGEEHRVGPEDVF